MQSVAARPRFEVTVRAPRRVDLLCRFLPYTGEAVFAVPVECLLCGQRRAWPDGCCDECLESVLAERDEQTEALLDELGPDGDGF